MDFPEIDLGTLGWSESRERDFEPFLKRGMKPGRVAAEDKHYFRVVTAQGELASQVSGKLLHLHRAVSELPKVGDWVAVAPLPDEEKGVIHQVLPRHTRLARKVAGRDIDEQVLATNIDVAFVVQALDQTFNSRRIERFLVMAHDGGAQPVVVLNKADLCAQLESRLAEARRAAGEATVVVTCARTGHGLDQLAALIGPGRTAVFIGTSGVGKSSLINRLYGDEVQPTLEVRGSDAKGRHSTTWRELILLPGGGLVIDTPGMREFHLWLADEGAAFPDIAEIALGCRFRNCGHGTEKGCAVQGAVADGRLSAARVGSFRKLKGELGYLAEETKRHTYRLNRRSSGRPRPKDSATDHHSDE